MSNSLSSVIIALAVVCSPAVALAGVDDRVGAYGVAGLGKGTFRAHSNQQAAGESPKALGSSKLAYTLGAGYRINRNLAIETDFSGVAKSRKGSSSRQDNGRYADVSSRAFTTSVLGIIPVGNRVELSGRVGAGRMQVRYAPADGTHTVNERGLAMQYGLGANLYLTDRSFLRSEYVVLRSRNGSDAAKAAGRERLDNSQLTVSYGRNF